MARKKKTTAAVIDERISDIDISAEMRGSFLEYAYSVIYARALPDARDGCKPVQRRIIYQMAKMGLTPTKGHVKSSRVVGDVMGKLHPHGDKAIYDAMVRMAQPFAMRLPMVDGHGNFGSLDDGPAAARYTEVRPTPAAMAMNAGLNEDTVDMVPNYDNQLLQPEVLPAAIPNLLVNGASGIAVGMATNMPPHNLTEVISAAKHLTMHPKASLDELMTFVPGPDLPTGGKIMGLDGIRQAYESGRGAFKTRATCRIENITARKKGIVITELPYLVGPEKVIDKLKDAVSSRKVTGVSGIQNLTDRHHGLRLIIELKNGFNPEAVLAKLYQHTPLEDSFSINNVALVDGQPRTLGLRELLEVFISHRLSVVSRRSAFRLAKAQEHLHLTEGLLLAIADIDEVIRIIRTSDDAQIARDRLMERFSLSEVQADHILALRLRRLTKFSRIELESTAEQLRADIEYLQEILDSEQRLREVVCQEMDEVAAEFGTPRRTVLLEHAPQVATQADDGTVPLEIPDEPCLLALSGTGLLARTSQDSPLLPVEDRASHDVIRQVISTTARAQVGVVFSSGRLTRLEVVEVPSLARSTGAFSLAGGTPISELAAPEKGEEIIGIVSLDPEYATPVIFTAAGKVKRVRADYPQRGDFTIISLDDGDRVCAVNHANDDDVLVMASTDAQLLRFSADQVRPQGRSGQGVAGMRLADGAEVLFGTAIAPDNLGAAQVVTIAGTSGALPGTQAGSAKVSPLDRFPAKNRATGGVRAQRFLRGEDVLLSAWAGLGPARAAGSGGQPIDLPEVDERRDGSGKPLSAPVAAIG